MKRIIFNIAILASVALGAIACVDQVFPKGTGPTPVVPAGDIEITIENVKDSSFTFVVAPEEEGLFYSYVVCEGEATAQDSMAIYQGKVSGIASNVVNYKEAPVSKDSLIGLMPFTSYTVYAVNSSKEGNVSSVAFKTVQTTDVVAPTVAKFSNEKNAVTIEFSEDVTYVEGKTITAAVYYKNYLTGSPWKSSVSIDKLNVEDNVVTFTLPEVTIPGSYFAIKWPAGTFKDAAGNTCAELASKFTSAIVVDKEGKESFTFEGVVGFLENDDLVYEVPEFTETSTWTDPINVHVPNGVSRIDLVDGYYTVIAHIAADGCETITAVPMKKLTNYYGTYYDVVLKIAGQEKAQAGDKIGIVIPAGAVMDWFGNVNKEDIEITCMPCPYQLSDFCGRYTVKSTCVIRSTDFTDTFDIETVEDATYNLVVSGTLAGKAVTIGAIAYPKDGHVEFPFQYLGQTGTYDKYLALADEEEFYTKLNLQWNLLASHTFVDFYSALGGYWATLAVSGGTVLGFFNALTINSIEYVGPVPAPTSASAKPASTDEKLTRANIVPGTKLPEKFRK